MRLVAIEFRVTRRPGAGRGATGGRRNVGTAWGWVVMPESFAIWMQPSLASSDPAIRMP